MHNCVANNSTISHQGKNINVMLHEGWLCMRNAIRAWGSMPQLGSSRNSTGGKPMSAMASESLLNVGRMGCGQRSREGACDGEREPVSRTTSSNRGSKVTAKLSWKTMIYALFVSETFSVVTRVKKY